MSNIFTCPNCGKKNRISESSTYSRAICASCWSNLNVPQRSDSVTPAAPPYCSNSQTKVNNRKGLATSEMVLLILSIPLLIYVFFLYLSYETPKMSGTPKRYERAVNATVYPEVTLPENGDLQFYSPGERIAPFEIKTASGANYLVKLVSAYSQDIVMTVFIRGGNTVSTEVPLGTYVVKYATGDQWYGYANLFGTDTAYSKADTVFKFKDDGYQISGYTITLYQVANGNLRTTELSPSQF